MKNSTEKSSIKSNEDIQRDMSALYEALLSGNTDLKTASELANIAGKNLKAKQLELAREIFEEHLHNLRAIGGGRPMASLPA